ncbi:MAG: ABC transporter ATP-binding protein [Bacteroidetes bacterium]|nr:ABC transporter ATP-binding protein [Bacteroidota bacterium]
MKLRGTSALSTINKLYKIFNRRQIKAFGWLAFLTFLSSIADLAGLMSVIPVVSLVLSEKSYQTITKAVPALSAYNKEQLLLITVGIFFALIVAKNLFGLYINRLQVRFVQNLYVSSSMNVLNKVYDRSLLDLLKNTSNELVNKLTGMQVSLCSNATISTIILINESMVFTLTAIIVCLWNWQLFVLLIGVLLPTMGYFYYRVKGMIKTAGTEKNNNGIQLYASAQEMIFGYTDIKIAGTENMFKKRFKELARKFSIHQGRMDFMLFIPTRILEIATFLGIILILLYGVYVIKDTEKIIGTISLFAVIAYRCIPSVNRFVIAVNNLNSNEFIFQDDDFLNEERTPNTGRDHAELVFNDKIVFDKVSYQYPGATKRVIENCELEIKKGDKIGVIGKSGAGKSTLINNILGFLQPTSGRITIDGTELSRNNVTDWWKITGYVRQEVFIMNTTLLENIAIGEVKDGIDINKVRRAVQLASLDSLVNELPDGLNTILNERGNNLSGGQKQRIAIARAIYKGAEVLIFDEATSALDSKTEEEITNAIQQLGHEQLTIVIIAHRYTSLRYCDKIYELDNGHISACLTYEDLVAQTNH